MKIKLYTIACGLMIAISSSAQEVEFTEYDLDNGLHVILHQENKAPVVTVGVMYHVGAKDEEKGRTGFAHFFEHLLFEGTQNIERGKWFDIVSANGGRNNANTTQDRTYYYETLPSNNLELALWMESERMLHPVINKIGVDTQNEVVKEEKRQRIDNAPYGKIIYRTGINKHLFKKHPYGQSVIGSMEDLDAAKLDEFIAFNKKFYNPNNATLVVAGDIQTEKAKKMISDYFGSIKNNGGKITRTTIKEDPITTEIKATEKDANIQIPAKVLVYRTPKQAEKDAYVLDYISTILTGGNSSRMYKNMVEDKKMALRVLAFTDAQEDYGTYIMGALPLGDVSLDKLQAEMDTEIKKNLINKEIEIYRSITREDIQNVAKKYLNKNQRLNLDYLPESGK